MKTRTKRPNSNKLLTISKLQLINRLAKIKGATLVTFTAFTDARCLAVSKSRMGISNNFGEIWKLARVTAIINNKYSNSVRNQEVREGQNPTFEASEPIWGEYSPKTNAIISNAPLAGVGKSSCPKHYLACTVRKRYDPVYLVRNADTGNSWKIIDKSKIEEFLPIPAIPRQGKNWKKVEYRRYSLDSINYIAFGGAKYRVRG